MSVETAVTFLRAMASSPQHRPLHCSFPTLSLFLKVLVIAPIQGGGTGVWLGPLLTPILPPTSLGSARLSSLVLHFPKCALYLYRPVPSPRPCLSPFPLSRQLCRSMMNLGEESLHSPASALPAPQEGVAPGT